MIHPFPPPLQLNKFSPYIHFPEFFSAEECTQIKNLMKGEQTYRAQIEGDGSGRDDQAIRGTTIFGILPIESNRWIFEKLQGAIIQANHDLYGYDLSGFCEGLQISRYDLGDHYGWHQDIGSGILSQRKLSLVAQLTDPAFYKGGELEFFRNGYAPKDLGTLILFPSFMHHRVLKITQGVRHSTVGWISGNPYK